jgi:hypothetical protein
MKKFWFPWTRNAYEAGMADAQQSSMTDRDRLNAWESLQEATPRDLYWYEATGQLAEWRAKGFTGLRVQVVGSPFGSAPDLSQTDSSASTPIRTQLSVASAS